MGSDESGTARDDGVFPAPCEGGGHVGLSSVSGVATLSVRRPCERGTVAYGKGLSYGG
ncbi:hypothetical protein GCM10010303_78240 [Streptomyces purpurascens]|nr:hypothetical protein GCM10010303_78240 [Streptomyces purpurascens]